MLTPKTYAEQTIIIAGQEIQPTYTKNGTGVYNKALNSLLEGFEDRVIVKFLPSQRVKRGFELVQHHCIFISTDTGDEFIRKGREAGSIKFIGPVNTVNVTAYTRRGLPDIKVVDDLRDKAFATDVNMVPFLEQRHDLKAFIAIQDQKQMMQLLRRGRVMALIGFDFDHDRLIKSLSLKDEIYKTSINLLSLNDGFMCHNTPETKSFVDHIETKLIAMKSNGELAQIFAP